MKNPSRGILLIATSHPYYGRQAVNLAMTIKAVEPDIPIALIADMRGVAHLNDAERNLFSVVKQPLRKGAGLLGANAMRMMLPALSPFQETLALDVDMLWLGRKKPSELFALLDGRDFTIVNEGFIDLDSGADHTTGRYLHWADPEALREAYDLKGRLYQVRGEFILFRKSKEVGLMYKSARNIQRNPGVATKLLGGSVTDEFALNLALNSGGIEPHESQWQPTYWPNIHGNIMPPVHTLHDSYYAVSFGGNYASPGARRAYTSVIRCGHSFCIAAPM